MFERNNGIFLKLFEFLAKFDSIADTHLQRAIKKERSELFGKRYPKKKSLKCLAIKLWHCRNDKKSKILFYYIGLYTRFKSYRTDVHRNMLCQYSIAEHFVGFVNVVKSTGKSLTDVTLKMLTDIGIDIKNMRGRGYHNGSNMKGKNIGVHRDHILNIN